MKPEIPTFKQYVLYKEGGDSPQSSGASGASGASGSSAGGSGGQGGPGKEWKKEFISMEKGFIPPPKMRPVVEAFLKSGEIKLMHDTSGKPVTMPKKSLFLVGGPVRDFIAGKAIKDFDLATNATPEQIALILASSGFTMSPDRSGKNDEEAKPLKLTFKPKTSKPSDRKTWFVKGRDQSGKVFVVSAVVDGEEFEIATFRRDAKVTDGAALVDFVDNPHEDASRRDLTINAMYIELTKADGENNRLYDPTGKGWHDIKNQVVRTVGRARDRFDEDKLRVMRAIRFHARFGKGARMDSDIENAIEDFADLRGVALERIRDEFLKGLLHPDVDVERYVKIYARTGLIERVFPGVQINMNIPSEFSSRRDKPLALAWLLQGNSLEVVESALGNMREVRGEQVPTGWTNQEKRAVLFLLELLEFSPQERPRMLKRMKGTGLSPDQVREWVNMFRVSDGGHGGGKLRDTRPTWAKHVRTFADHDRPLAHWGEIEGGEHDKCPQCKGQGCAYCGGGGKLPQHMRGGAVDALEAERFASKISATK
jgi:tRNA nucleotidyltransferase/poly(A) polymerase